MGEDQRSRSGSRNRWRVAACIAGLYSLFGIIVAFSSLLIVWGYPAFAGLLLTGGGISLAALWGFRFEQIQRACMHHAGDDQRRSS